MNNLKLHIVPVLSDNYIWLLENKHQQVVIIDPGEAKPVIDYIAKHQLSPIGVLLTHHHHDHIDGVPYLQQYYPNIPVYGPDEVPLAIIKISDQKSVTIADLTFTIIPVPGHTLGHLAYYIKPYLFCGDTLFSAGCGRIFEGSYQQMFDSVNKLKTLPDNTVVCPAHEYTVNNLKFAIHLLNNEYAINHYYQEIKNKNITLPTSIRQEKEINLFLRCDDQFLQRKFNCDNSFSLFQFFRTQKDNF